MQESQELTNAHNRLSSETNKIMSSLLEDSALLRQNDKMKQQPLEKAKKPGSRRLSLPKLKEPCPLTPDGTDLIDEKSTNARRLSYF